jgi:hypothetical protein
MSADELSRLIDELKDVFVTDSRARAIAATPYLQPPPEAVKIHDCEKQGNKPAELSWTLSSSPNASFLGKPVKNSLVIHFTYPTQPDSGESDISWKSVAICKMYHLFYSTVNGKQLLRALADFPMGTYIDPEEMELSSEFRPPSIKQIEVTFEQTFVPNTDPNHGTSGETDAGEECIVPKERHTVWIRTQRDNPEAPGGLIWPGSSCEKNIKFFHRKGESRMAVLLFHELLHIWFVHRFGYLPAMSCMSGHGTDMLSCSYFDLVQIRDSGSNKLEDTYPLFDWLLKFFDEINTKEAKFEKYRNILK